MNGDTAMEKASDAGIDVEGDNKPSPSKLSAVLMMVWSAIALASDGYNSQALGSANVMLEKIYGDEYAASMEKRVSTAYYVGLCLGAVTFGTLIDRFSRKSGIVLATCLVIIGVALCTGSWAKTPHMMFWMLTVSRGILGFGAGGEYPVCSTGVTEAGDETTFVRKCRGLIVGLAGCTAIDLGIVFGGILPMIILAGYGYRASHDTGRTSDLEGAWRITLALGCIVPASVFFFRWKMATSSAFSNHAMTKNLGFKVWAVAIKTYWPRMIGTCLCWFVYDFIAYPFGLFSPAVVEGLPGAGNTMIRKIGYSAVINAFLIPGCIVGSLMLDKFGRRNTQAFGFFMQCVIGCILAGAIRQIRNVFPLFIVLYGLLLSFGELGPGVATLLNAAESYPTCIRGHMTGLSAAIAKAGAAIGTEVFSDIIKGYGSSSDSPSLHSLRVVVAVGAALAFFGAVLTMLCFPGRHSEELQNEDERFREILKQHGLDGYYDVVPVPAEPSRLALVEQSIANDHVH